MGKQSHFPSAVDFKDSKESSKIRYHIKTLSSENRPSSAKKRSTLTSIVTENSEMKNTKRGKLVTSENEIFDGLPICNKEKAFDGLLKEESTASVQDVRKKK